MLINEVAKACNITKKAVQYYVEQGFVQPTVLQNGYRDFSEQDVARFRQIALYRKLGLSIDEIRRVLEHPGEMNAIVYRRTLTLEKEKLRQTLLKRLSAGEAVEHLAAEIDAVSAGTVIIRRLLDLFPGDYGRLISLHFGPYLTEPIETAEQMRAFQQIVDFFDQVPAIDLPKDLQDALVAYEGNTDSETLQRMLQEQDHALQNIDAFVARNRETVDAYIRLKQTDAYRSLPAVRLMETMKQICAANGYYDIFIPAMRKLSPLYDRYYKQLLKADARFSQHYPEYLV